MNQEVQILLKEFWICAIIINNWKKRTREKFVAVMETRLDRLFRDDIYAPFTHLDRDGSFAFFQENNSIIISIPSEPYICFIWKETPSCSNFKKPLKSHVLCFSVCYTIYRTKRGFEEKYEVGFMVETCSLATILRN